ncbi:hypothetical protein [Xanthovirga aplysinae]|uniref:hypothetical protein n=1 Tax=Xanthovirga aplysinae TaxID=2529853 RepID=UPI0012BC142C|nr:hypothetical protein [Xanthovirga aplysinae]MTI29261.1 hypothetical protein [Xanthovirga aplysinae]
MNEKITSNIINGMSVISMIAGIFGMLFCFPFLWSPRIEDLVGAGFPFVGGALLFGSGLITLGLFNRKTK